MTAVSNLVVEEELNFEFRVKDVVFVDPKKISRRRKRLLGDVQKFSDLKRRYKLFKYAYSQFFESVDCVAILRRTGKPKELLESLIKSVSDEVAVLSLSQLGYAKRRSSAAPAVRKGGSIQRESLFLDTGSDS